MKQPTEKGNFVRSVGIKKPFWMCPNKDPDLYDSRVIPEGHWWGYYSSGKCPDCKDVIRYRAKNGLANNAAYTDYGYDAAETDINDEDIENALNELRQWVT